MFRKFPNVIMTPHIGGSTLEAQENIGSEVANKITKYCSNGISLGTVNFPAVNLPIIGNHHRVVNIHNNVPGILAAINDIFSEHKINISSQYLQTNDNIGYVVTDVDKLKDCDILRQIQEIPGSIKSRFLF